MTIILHTTNCPNCKVLEQKLDQAGIEYTKNCDANIMLEKGMLTAPGLEIDGNYPLDFLNAVKWVNSQKKG